MTDELYNSAINLASIIKETKEYQELKSLEEIINNKYQKEISEFNQAKEKVDNLNKYSPDYQEKKNDMLKKKERLYQLDEVIKYKKLEIKINKMLKEISDQIKELL